MKGTSVKGAKVGPGVLSLVEELRTTEALRARARVLSVRQPWASLIASGAKTVELRTWPTTWRGPLLIASSLFGREPRRGVLLCVCELIEVRRSVPEDASSAHHPIESSHYSWILDRVEALPELEFRGSLGLRRVPPEFWGAIL